MKHIKMLGLATLALSLLAVVGAGTASASHPLCATNTIPCTSKYKTGTKISSQLAPGTVATLTASTTVTCTKSGAGGVTTNESGSGEITSFTFSGCHTTAGTHCTVSAVQLPYFATATTNALYVTPRAGNPGAKVECGSFINCTFGVSSITLGVVSGNTPHVTATNEPLNGTGFLCPSEARWDATYEITSPKPLYLV